MDPVRFDQVGLVVRGCSRSSSLSEKGVGLVVRRCSRSSRLSEKGAGLVVRRCSRLEEVRTLQGAPWELLGAVLYGLQKHPS